MSHSPHFSDMTDAPLMQRMLIGMNVIRVWEIGLSVVRDMRVV